MSIYDLKKNVRNKISQSYQNKSQNMSTENTFRFKSYTANKDEDFSNQKTSVYNQFGPLSSTFSSKTPNRQQNLKNKLSSENMLSGLMHSKMAKSGKIGKQKSKKPMNTNLECFNLMEKEKFRLLIEQSNDNYRPSSKSHQNTLINQRNMYKNFIHASPTKIRDDNNSDSSSSNQPTGSSRLVSGGYTRRISLSLDTKPDSLLFNKSTANKASYFNKYSNKGVLKNTSNQNKQFSQKYHSNKDIQNRSQNKNVRENSSVIDLIDISSGSNTNNVTRAKLGQKRSGPLLDENDKRNDIENFRKEKKDFFAQYLMNNTEGNYSKLNRSLNDFEKSIDNRLKNNQNVIEAVLKKSQTKLDANLLIEEERYKLKKRARQEKDLIERELAQKFTQQLHVDANKLTGKYLEEELEPEEKNDFPELTQNEHINQIESALINSPQDEALVNSFNISICRKDIQTLKGLNWLNDEVINFYMSLICERSKTESDSYPLKTHAFTTFFYPKLMKDGYSMLRRWTRKIDVFSFDLILVPLHLGLHWTLAVIDFNCREIRYYDSMNGNNAECLKALKNYLNEEHKDKKGSPYDLSDWNFLHNKNLPQQMNGSDCGMFACKYSEYLSRGKTSFNFNQSHMPYFRRRMVWEILNSKLMT